MKKKTKPNTTKKSAGLTAEEKAAMREYAQERRNAGANDEAAVLAKIKTMTGSDRVMAERIHAIVKAAAPELGSRTWYGMPAYTKDDKVVCFFQDAKKFKSRYATFGFSDKANLDDGNMWPTSFALKQMTPTDEAKITALVKKAIS